MTKTASNNDLSISSDNSPKKGMKRKVAQSGHFFSKDKIHESTKILGSHHDKSLSSVQSNTQSHVTDDSLNKSEDSEYMEKNNKLMFDRFNSQPLITEKTVKNHQQKIEQ